MKSQKEFEQYFESKLLPKLLATENEKISIKKRFSFKKYGRNLIILVCFCIFMACLRNYRPSLPELAVVLPGVFTALYLFFAPIIIFVRRNLAFSKIDDTSVKKEIVPELIDFIDKDLKYEQTGTLPAGLYDVHSIYLRTRSFPECTSSDLVSGKLDNWNLHLADTLAFISSRGGSVQDRIRCSAVYAVLDLHQKTQGSIYLCQLNNLSASIAESMQSVESFKSQLNQVFQSISGSEKELLDDNLPEGFVLTETGNPDFDLQFRIAIQENEKGDKLLSQEFCTKFKNVCDQTKLQLGIAIKGNQLHVTIQDIDLFESDVHASSTTKEGRFSPYTWFNVFSAITRITALVEEANKPN